MKKSISFLIALVVLMATANDAFAAKKKPFYDVKSQLLGISGNVDPLIERGFEKKIFRNDIPINIDIPELSGKQKKKGWDEKQIRQITEQLNIQRVGQQVLNYLCPLKWNEKDSIWERDDSILNARALENVQFTDIEKAKVGLDEESILRDDWEPILKNNYIYLEQQVEDFADFIVFKVKMPDDIVDLINNNWREPDKFEAINPRVEFLYTGGEKFKNPEKFQRKLSENVSSFAIRGQLTGRNPATARIGSNSGLNIGDQVTIYRQSMDKNGEMVSNRISRARVCDISDDDCQMFFTSGTRGSYKDGDMVVLTPDKKQGVGIYANYSLGHFFGGSLMWDCILNVTKAGFSGRLLGEIKVDYADYDNELYREATEVLDGYEINPPVIFDASVGYGLTWTLLGRFEVMPYAMIGAEYLRSFNTEEKQPDVHAIGIRGNAGVRFDINIAYPVKLSFGAEYAYVYGLDASKSGSSGDNKAVWVDYKDFYGTLFKLNGVNKKKLDRNGINFFAGIRYVF